MAGSGRRRPAAAATAPRALLSVERIVDRAMQLAAAEGAAGVTMRRLGDSLAVQPMSLYHHVPSKAALIRLMAERSAAPIISDDDARGGCWDQRLLQLLTGLYRAGVDNPTLINLLAAAPEPCTAAAAGPPEAGGHLAEVLRRVHGLLEQAPLPENAVSFAYHGVIAIVTGSCVQAAEHPAREDHTHHVQICLTAFLHGISAAAPAEPSRA